MELSELIKRLGISECPEALYKIYDGLTKEDDGAIYDPEYIRGLEEKYGLLGDYYELIQSQALEFKKHEGLVLYARTVAAYNDSVKTSPEARLIKLPPLDGSPERDVFPTLVILAAIPSAVKEYERRGFAAEEIRKNVCNLRENLYVLDLCIGRPCLDQGHYNWLCHYIKGMIFDYGVFNFQPHVWKGGAIYLKNRTSGEILPMMYRGSFHKSGLALGSAGCTDEDGSYEADFTECDDAYVGRLVHGCRVDNTVSTLKKSEWECILAENDNVCNLHIPRGANITPDVVIQCMREGLTRTREHYPELDIKVIVCSSCMLDPQLVDILGEGAKISSFVNRFLKFPVKSAGGGCLSYVFPGYQGGAVSDFPEKSSLQRGIKKLMLDGGYILGASGLVAELVD
jgi:hypothetical protein